MIRDYPDIGVRVVGQASEAAAAAVWEAVKEWLLHEEHEGTRMKEMEAA
jgi:hypothetical protein